MQRIGPKRPYMVAMVLLGLLAISLSAQTPPAGEAFAPGVVCTEGFESHPEFSPDGKTLYFVKSTPQFTEWKIWISHLKGGQWTAPEMAPFSGKYRDADPFITADGKRFFFISDRPAPGKTDTSMDIWFMPRTRSGWGEPVRLGPEVNSETDEWFPTVTRSGTLFFGSARRGTLGGTDLWCSALVKGKYQEARNLGPTINSPDEEIEPYVSPDGKLLIFNAVHAEGLGGLDFYSARWLRDGWGEVKHLPVVNTRGTELSPKLSRDGKRFFFTGVRKGRLGEILSVPVEGVGL